ncbi:putative terpenoid cyclases/protein prenyltransferase alpha-alpha toroid [Septoria linicola]|nr:putative terpenoid cyclases/protein prenyltransferase alpha-alpha toroid [Septoria linicola]
MTIDLAEPVLLNKDRQVKYWKRCLKTLLPHHYTGNEGNRMYLGFFMLSALDLLDSWHDVANETERNDYVNWIYRCQHPDGGFRMWPGTDFDQRRNDENAKWDPANVPATFFALSALLVAGDDLTRVRRKATLEWICRMQRPDGSFGETNIEGTINGGMDPRFGYCATGVRYILRGNESGPLTLDGTTVADIEVDRLVGCIRLAESYDGGIADSPYHEPHAGYEYCALGALNFLGRLATPRSDKTDLITGPSDPGATIRWLIERQTDLEDLEEELEFEDDDDEAEDETQPASKKAKTEPAADSPIAEPVHQSPERSTLITGFSLEHPDAGMNGRTGKVADTCYAWWAGASFHLMQEPQLYCQSRLRRYLLEKTQHPVLGGFGKYPGDLPDLYHSYLALAALGLDGVEGVQPVDPAMCISKRASARLDTIWKSWKN